MADPLDLQTPVEKIKAKYPHGHKAFNDLMLDMMRLHSEKNQGYAGGGRPLGNFERAAKIMEQYPNFPVRTPEGMLVMYMMKHIDRILWDMNTGKAPSDESLGDICIYAAILRCMEADRAAALRQSNAKP